MHTVMQRGHVAPDPGLAQAAQGKVDDAVFVFGEGPPAEGEEEVSLSLIFYKHVLFLNEVWLKGSTILASLT